LAAVLAWVWMSLTLSLPPSGPGHKSCHES
jgi:hypothetical protein